MYYVIRDMYYIIRGMYVCIIFNHQHFVDRIKKRDESDLDALALFSLFQSSGFEVKFDYLSQNSLYKELKCLRKQDYSDCEVFIIRVLSHGSNGLSWARDQQYMVEDLWIPFIDKECPSLARKPKLFFIQACHDPSGMKDHVLKDTDSSFLIDEGDPALDDSQAYFNRFMMHPDTLIAFSTIPGYYLFRNGKKGPWFIESLVSVMRKKAHSLDLMTMLTLVNRKVSYKYRTNMSPKQIRNCHWTRESKKKKLSLDEKKPSLDEKKQVPCVTSGLTRFLISSLQERKSNF